MHWERAAHVEADRLQECIVSGAVHGDVNGISEAAWEQIDLRLRNAALLATSFREAGFTAIIDDISTGKRLDQLLSALDGSDIYFVMLLRDLDVLKSEWRAINSPFVDAFDWIDDEIANATEKSGLWIDTTHRSVDETVSAIIARLDEARVTPATR
jgi:hypothetical protein